ncbi:MAG: DNA mismatch repair endonuclease MutL, partial [Firmicutes bacterium]|nr:DNA mismatch repair endonuclease MutL [Bacillota bacterium]
MGKINLLSGPTINKIAAGEVVERPGSVIKELVENSIDAGSTAITIEIREGGISYIKVLDNGSGISAEDIENAFLRHATSKIKDVRDLETVLSMGFRGEALASIAAVAQVELTSKTVQEELGKRIIIAGGEVREISEYAGTSGTNIIVRNLFYNVPARLKFLKKASAEAAFISDIVNKLAMGNPGISFKYINNGNVILHTPGSGQLKEAFYHVYGKDIASKVLEINEKDGEMRLFGLIGTPDLGRANRSYENLYINGRFVRNSLVASAVEAAYKTRLLIGRFPVYVLHLDIPPQFVDVNVHPAKLEVKFSNENTVYDFFFKAVSKALKNAVFISEENWGSSRNVASPKKTLPPEDMEQKKPHTDKKAAEAAHNLSGNIKKSFEKYSIIDQNAENTSDFSLAQAQSFFELSGYINSNNMIREDIAEYRVEPEKNVFEARREDILVETSENIVSEKKSEKKPQAGAWEAVFNNYRIVGQIFRTYWILEQGD